MVGDADWGLIRLDRPVADHAPLPVRRSGRVAAGRNVTAIGHPVGLPRKYAGGPTTTVRDNSDPDFFQANVDTYGGSSGSPVLDSATLVVEGILVRGNPDFTSAGGCDRSNACPDGGCPGWEDATRVTAFSALLVSYDVYLGTDAASLPRLASDLPAAWYRPAALEAGRQYFWRVVARNLCGSVEGPVWSFTTAGAVRFLRADSTADGQVNLTDAVFTLRYLFQGGPGPTCDAAADANGDLFLDLSDAVYTLLWLFRSGRPPPAPGASTCGAPGPEDLPCLAFAACTGG